MQSHSSQSTDLFEAEDKQFKFKMKFIIFVIFAIIAGAIAAPQSDQELGHSGQLNHAGEGDAEWIGQPNGAHHPRKCHRKLGSGSGKLLSDGD